MADSIAGLAISTNSWRMNEDACARTRVDAMLLRCATTVLPAANGVPSGRQSDRRQPLCTGCDGLGTRLSPTAAGHEPDMLFNLAITRVKDRCSKLLSVPGSTGPMSVKMHRLRVVPAESGTRICIVPYSSLLWSGALGARILVCRNHISHVR
jgi:hypothetical protein